MPSAIGIIPRDGYIEVDITASGTDTGPYTVNRRVSGGTFVRVGKDIALGENFLDYGVAKDVVYEYQVEDPVGGTLVSSGSTTFLGVWLHTLGDNSTAHNFFYDGQGRDSDRSLRAEAEHYHGNSYPQVTFSASTTDEVNVDLQLVDDDDSAMELIVRNRKPVCYRDGRGRLVLGVVRGFSLKETSWGAECSLNVVATDATLEV